jgi:hypothetical protein
VVVLSKPKYAKIVPNRPRFGLLVYHFSDQWDKTERLEVQVMETRKSVLGADHPDILRTRVPGTSLLWDKKSTWISKILRLLEWPGSAMLGNSMLLQFRLIVRKCGENTQYNVIEE